MHLFTSRFVERPAAVTELPGSVTTPAGFTATGIAAGLKKSGKPDLGLLVAQGECTSAALFTPNAAAAAPIRVCREETDIGAIQGIVVNSGSANACTGAQGLEDAREMVRLAEAASGVAPGRMAVASTGVIGHLLDMELVSEGIGQAAAALSETGGESFADAIQTTDAIDKEGAVEVALPEGKVHIGICAKGAGMIAPNLATLLVFVTTDVDAPPGLLYDALTRAVAGSFNSVSVDGDMSTNDCIFMLASGMSGVRLAAGSPGFSIFTEALSSMCKSVALKVVADGEGATKTVELNVTGAASVEEAARVARANALSPLVRTAFFGRDANWGRLLAAAGAALAGEAALAADVCYEDVCLARAGTAAGGVDVARLEKIMAQPEISVTVDLQRGGSSYRMYFSDLTHDYVTLNAEYTT